MDNRKVEYMGSIGKGIVLGVAVSFGYYLALKNFINYKLSKDVDEEFHWEWIDKEEAKAILKGGAIGGAFSVGAGLINCSNDKLFENAYAHMQLNKNLFKKTT